MRLDQPLSSFPGFTEALRHRLLTGLSITTVGSFLAHYPARYDDRTVFRELHTVQAGKTLSIRGTVSHVENVPNRSGMNLTRIAVTGGSEPVHLVFFNQWYLAKQFRKYIGADIVAFGRVSRTRGGQLELTDVEWEPYQPEIDSLSSGRVVPVYRLTEGISQRRMRKLMHSVLASAAELETEWIPERLRRERNLVGIALAVRAAHFPDSYAELTAAQNRLVYSQFLLRQLWGARERRSLSEASAPAFVNIDEPMTQFRESLSFTLTGSQQRVISEIAKDLQGESPMNRLVQGDVGSGKTVIALAAIVISVRNGYQSAVLVPTEILAEQHFRNFAAFLSGLGISVALLTSNRPAADRRRVLREIRDGTVDVVVGTHAIIQDSVEFFRLGLAVVDEQHRFGVMQRTALKEKGRSPHVLVMTATPIPRTLTWTIHGDLDVSIVDELPPGRKSIKTHWKKSPDRDRVYNVVAELVRKGSQAYVVCSLIDENPKIEAEAVVTLASELQATALGEARIGMVHGQMTSAQKQDVMESFRDGRIDVIVATTVVEVGVDVPNATIIVVENAERFGMAQLHQLRGRVGRGDRQSYCILIGDTSSDNGTARLQTLAGTSNGFEIAEADLRLRGPGDYYGTRQSGMQTLPFLDIERHVELLQFARADAFNIVDRDPDLLMSCHLPMRAVMQETFAASPSAGG